MNGLNTFYQQIVDKFVHSNSDWVGVYYIGVIKADLCSEGVKSFFLFEPEPKDFLKARNSVPHFILVDDLRIIDFISLRNKFEGENLDEIHTISKFQIKHQLNINLPANEEVKYTAFLQEKADNYIKEHKSAYVISFIGSYYGCAVFHEFMFCDSRIRPTGAPYFLLVDKDGNTKWICNFDDRYMGSFHIIKNMIPSDLCVRKGEEIYDQLMSKYENGNYNKNEQQYLKYLKMLDLKHWSNDGDDFIDITRNTIFFWLEAANRIGDEIFISELDYNTKYVGFRKLSLE